MTQSQLNREVAQMTGESVELIANMGFSVFVVPPRRMPMDNRARLGALTNQAMRRCLKARKKTFRKLRTEPAAAKMPALAGAA